MKYRMLGTQNYRFNNQVKTLVDYNIWKAQVHHLDKGINGRIFLKEYE